MKHLNSFFVFVIDKPGVAGAGLQTASELIHWLSHRPLHKKSSKHLQAQIVGVKDLKFHRKASPSSSPPPCPHPTPPQPPK